MSFNEIMDRYEEGCTTCMHTCNNVDCPKTKRLMDIAEKQKEMTPEEKKRYFELMKG